MDEVDACTGLDRVTVVHPDGTVALRDVTLLARPGELLAVLGPSGCGKSTALRAIAGLTKLASGRVLIAGQITTAEPAYRDVAMVFENTHLVPFMGVARNIVVRAGITPCPEGPGSGAGGPASPPAPDHPIAGAQAGEHLGR